MLTRKFTAAWLRKIYHRNEISRKAESDIVLGCENQSNKSLMLFRICYELDTKEILLLIKDFFDISCQVLLNQTR